jgi:hypothetical protein
LTLTQATPAGSPPIERPLPTSDISGVQVLGIISATIAIVDAIAKVSDTATDASSLPEAFRDDAKRLPLVR